ncbi:hypothetical protein THAOC_29612, partial [Thalassiosira oceanica]
RRSTSYGVMYRAVSPGARGAAQRTADAAALHRLGGCELGGRLVRHLEGPVDTEQDSFEVSGGTPDIGRRGPKSKARLVKKNATGHAPPPGGDVPGVPPSGPVSRAGGVPGRRAVT